MQYPIEKIKEAATKLPEPVQNARAFAIDDKHSAVLEYRAVQSRNPERFGELGWEFAGVSKAFTVFSGDTKESSATRITKEDLEKLLRENNDSSKGRE